MIRVFVMSVFILLSFNGFSQKNSLLVKELKKPVNINYGTKVTYDFFLVRNKNNKEISMVSSQLRNMDVEVKNGNFLFVKDGANFHGELYIAAYPESVYDTITEITFKYTEGDEELSQTFRYVLNFKGDIRIDFSGSTGADGRVGWNKTLAGAVFNFGGNEGQSGINGRHGGFLKAYYTRKPITESDTLTVLEVFDIKNQKYVYHIRDEKTIVRFDLSGGDGGDGGNGQRGSNTFSSKADGGDGGKGGNGGNGGVIELYIDKELAVVKENLRFNIEGGLGGNGGEGGKEGRSRSGSSSSFVGKPGRNGERGSDGLRGREPIVVIKD
jgi:hypothetical protein